MIASAISVFMRYDRDLSSFVFTESVAVVTPTSNNLWPDDAINCLAIALAAAYSIINQSNFMGIAQKIENY